MIYIYTRSLQSDGLFNIDNVIRKNVDDEQIHLSKEIEFIFPDRSFKIESNGKACKIIFDKELTSSEKTTLDLIVNDHKKNIVR